MLLGVHCSVWSISIALLTRCLEITWVGGSYSTCVLFKQYDASLASLFVSCFGLDVGCLIVLNCHDLLSCTCIEGRIGNVCLVSAGAALVVPDLLCVIRCRSWKHATTGE